MKMRVMIWNENLRDYQIKDFPIDDIGPDFSLSAWYTPSNFDENRLPKSTVRCTNGKKYWSNEDPEDLKDRYNLSKLP